MNGRKRTVMVLAILACFALPSPHVSAHELLPRQLIDYLQTHPNATAQDIDAFMNATPELAHYGLQQKAELIASARNPDAGFFHNGWDFVVLGFQHILSGPDHVLFILSLMLVYVSFIETLKDISAFTVAHSTSLLLAGAGLIVLSPRIVEPIIALSIAYVAVTTVFFSRIRFFSSSLSKVLTVFVFGLFHGLGFAGLLTDLGIPQNRFISSLLFFNLGIEGGQLLIILCVLPLVYAFRKKAWYPRVIQVTSVAVTALALFWVVQRIFFMA